MRLGLFRDGVPEVVRPAPNQRVQDVEQTLLFGRPFGLHHVRYFVLAVGEKQPPRVTSKPARVYDFDQSVLIGLTGMVFRLLGKVKIDSEMCR